MEKDFFLVNKKILPDYFEKVVIAKEMIEGENKKVTEVCKKLDISRSTYYKYKDYIMYPSKNVNKKAILAFKVCDTQGVLSQILTCISLNNCNVLTISQDMPIRNIAHITIMIDIENIGVELNELLKKLRELSHVKNVEVLDYE